MKLIARLQHIDQQVVQQGHITAEALMENAGAQVAAVVQSHCRPEQRGVILCGPGNNGGDGFACARLLYQAGYRQISVIYTGKRYRNEALAQLERLLLLPIPVIQAGEQPQIAQQHIAQSAFIVDALLGSGLNREVAGLELALIEAVARRRQTAPLLWTLSVDLPSGIDGATGQRRGPLAIQADITLTLAVSKPGLHLYPGKALAGMVFLADIGIPARLIDDEPSDYQLITPAMANAWLPSRPADSHKYHYGHVLVVAGSQTMPGAAILCAQAALSAGAGLVTLAAPARVFEQLPLAPEIMRLPLPDTHQLGPQSLSLLSDQWQSGRYTTMAIGPGLGRAPDTQASLAEWLAQLAHSERPVVLDADALNSLAQGEQPPPPLGAQAILTPHVGEAARLLHSDTTTLAADLCQSAQAIRQHYQTTTVLKSAATVIASIHHQTYISPTGNSGMATAGCGDVLTGIIAALAAQYHARGQAIWPAAPLGVYLHGLAGQAALDQRTAYAMRASDLIEALPRAFQELLAQADRDDMGLASGWIPRPHR